jgi:hypothetical protein
MGCLSFRLIATCSRYVAARTAVVSMVQSKYDLWSLSRQKIKIDCFIETSQYRYIDTL